MFHNSAFAKGGFSYINSDSDLYDKFIGDESNLPPCDPPKDPPRWEPRKPYFNSWKETVIGAFFLVAGGVLVISQTPALTSAFHQKSAPIFQPFVLTKNPKYNLEV